MTKFAVLLPVDERIASDEAARIGARDLAVSRWYGELRRADETPLGEPVATWLEPVILDGQPIRFELEDGTESPPMWAWRVEGEAAR